ncbi:MAG: hypothetical protein ACI8TP_002753 [Acidimicrobiales bacterium]|jgi:hypothetical protein
MGQMAAKYGGAISRSTHAHPPIFDAEGITSALMGLRCARIECNESATASLLFKADDSEVHLIDLAEATAGIPLCPKHTRSRNAPVGWELVDHRSGAQAELWRTDAPPPPVNGPDERPPRRRATDKPFAWGRDARAEEAADPTAGVTEFEANSPLLSRAFSPVQD